MPVEWARMPGRSLLSRFGALVRRRDMSTHESSPRGGTKRKKISAGAMAPMVAMEAYTRARVSRADSHLIRLRISAVNGCRYCTAMHRRDARKDGWDDARILAAELASFRAHDLPEDQRVVARFADAVTHIDGEESVPDELWAEVVRHRGESGAGQLLMEIVTINAWNRIAVATRLDPRSLKGVEERDIDPVRPS